jgi:hypothetical protein
MKNLGHDLKRERDDFVVDRPLKRGPSGIKLSDGLGQQREILLSLRFGMSLAVCQTSLIFRQAVIPSERAVVPECLKWHTLHPYRTRPDRGMLQDRLVGAQPMEFQQPTDGGEDNVMLKWFRQEIAGAGSHRTDSQFDRSGSGHHDADNAIIDPLCLLQNCDAISVRQGGINDQQCRSPLPDYRKRLLS